MKSDSKVGAHEYKGTQLMMQSQNTFIFFKLSDLQISVLSQHARFSLFIVI
jgi:hypothetical protein